jgi:eukaryotic-like serine/threonine-protein kinase
MPADSGHDRFTQDTDSGWPGMNDDSISLEKTVPISAAAISAALEPSSELEGRSFGKFRLEQEIARGGMGVILRSSDLVLNREVAIKLLLKTHLGKPHLHQQFMNEVRITGALQHPGIIPIYETGCADEDRPFFAMKFVQGRTLAQMLASRKSPDEDLPRFLKIFEQVCQTLSYTHSRGVIHLDIKPANVMVGRFGEVHLMDWGLAQASAAHCAIQPSDDLTEAAAVLAAAERLATQNAHISLPEGAVWGTPAYMSPEQARGQCMDVRSDVFGLGGILCEILTGYPPHHGKSLIDVCFKVAQGNLSFAFENLDKCQADGVLVRLARKCLSPQPDARPLDAQCVATELTLYLESLLQQAQRDLERFFDLSLDLFCIAGLDGYFRRVNSNFPRVLGFSDKDLVSRPFLEFVHPDDRQQTVSVMEQLHAGLPVIQFRNRYQTSDGAWRYFEWTAKSIPAEGVIFAVARDITGSIPRTGDLIPLS